MIKEVNYTKGFGERLAQKRDMMGFPRSVVFEITHRCNLRCRHCCVVPELDKKELSTKEAKSIFEQLIEAGCLHLTLTGGEPLVRGDIFSLMDYARRIGLFIHLLTNATLITAKVADKLKELKLVSLEMSFHSLKKERFDWFTQVEGSFDKVMEAIRLLRERRQELTLKINITKANLDEVEDLKEFVRNLEAIPEWATVLMPRSDGSRDKLFLRLEPEEVLKVGDILLPEPIDEEKFSLGESQEDKEPSCAKTKDGKSDDKPGRNRGKDRLFQCGAGKVGLVISPYGELKPCLEFPSSGYSILGGSLKEGWKRLGDYIESFKPGPEHKCLDCNLRDFCLSCPARARSECGNMNCCPDYYRRLAELTAKSQSRLLNC